MNKDAAQCISLWILWINQAKRFIYAGSVVHKAVDIVDKTVDYR